MKTPDSKMDAAATKQFLFKPGTMTRLAILIVKQAIQHPTFWPDQIDQSWLAKADTKCVGNVYRLLIRAGVIRRTGLHRRSEAKSRSGGEVFEYSCRSVALAKTFLSCHGEHQPVVESQIDLFAAPPKYPH